MDRGMVIFLGAMLTFTSSWLGLVFAPMIGLGKIKAHVVDETTNEMYPKPLSGIVAEGFEVYKESGCIYCHSQQVRAETFGNNADIKRGWGERRTFPRDYIYDKPIMLGTMRTGPDLSTVSKRLPSEDWHHKHLWNPQWVVPGSIMPPFAYLYETRKILGQPDVNALNFGDDKNLVPPGYEVVPTSKAKALVAYLLSLDKASKEIPEMKE